MVLYISTSVNWPAFTLGPHCGPKITAGSVLGAHSCGPVELVLQCGPSCPLQRQRWRMPCLRWQSWVSCAAPRRTTRRRRSRWLQCRTSCIKASWQGLHASSMQGSLKKCEAAGNVSFSCGCMHSAQRPRAMQPTCAWVRTDLQPGCALTCSGLRRAARGWRCSKLLACSQTLISLKRKTRCSSLMSKTRQVPHRSSTPKHSMRRKGALQSATTMPALRVSDRGFEGSRTHAQ